MVDMPVAMHFGFQIGGQAVDHRAADAVQPAGYFVSPAAELAAGVQGGHHRFQPGLAGGRMHIHRDAPAVVGNGNQPIPAQGQVDPGAVAGHSLVHGVVQDFVDQVVQAALVGAADIHPGPDADGFQSLQHLNVFGGIFGGRVGYGRHRAGAVSGGVGRPFRGGGFDRLGRVGDEKRLLNSQFLTPAMPGWMMDG